MFNQRGFALSSVLSLLLMLGVGLSMSARPVGLDFADAYTGPQYPCGSCGMCYGGFEGDIYASAHVFPAEPGNGGTNPHSDCKGPASYASGCGHAMTCRDGSAQISEPLTEKTLEFALEPTRERAKALLAEYDEYVSVNLTLGTVDVVAPCATGTLLGRIPLEGNLLELALLDQVQTGSFELALK